MLDQNPTIFIHQSVHRRSSLYLLRVLCNIVMNNEDDKEIRKCRYVDGELFSRLDYAILSTESDYISIISRLMNLARSYKFILLIMAYLNVVQLATSLSASIAHRVFTADSSSITYRITCSQLFTYH